MVSITRLVCTLVLVISTGIAIHAQSVIGIMPIQGNTEDETQASRLFAHALRSSLADLGYRTVSDRDDPILEEMLLELARMGDTGSISLFEKLAAHSRAEEFILVDYQLSLLKIDWKNTKGETVSGISLQFIPNYHPDANILKRSMQLIILPELLNIPKKAGDTILPFFLPGYGHLRKGYHAKGSLFMALGFGSLGSAGLCLAQAVTNYNKSMAAESTSIRDYHYQTSQVFSYAAIASIALYVGTAIISGTQNTRILDRELDLVIVR